MGDTTEAESICDKGQGTLIESYTCSSNGEREASLTVAVTTNAVAMRLLLPQCEDGVDAGGSLGWDKGR